MDKLDRLGTGGVRELLTTGRRDASGDFTPGAQLTGHQAERVLGFIGAGGGDRREVCSRLRALAGESRTGNEGVDELEQIDRLLDAMGLGSDRVVFDPSVVRGLAYYTGPVFEAVLTFEVAEEEGQRRQFGSVAGGGRYDDLVRRFTGTLVPATGCSIGVERLLAALKALGRAEVSELQGPVVVVVLEPERLPEYQRMVAELRNAGISAELYLGSGGFRAQLRYANRRRSPVAVIAGGDEFGRGEVSIKNLNLGRELFKEIKEREVLLKEQPAQSAVPRERLVEAVREVLGR
jgi:histidyl-tRNA synthetase